MNNSLATRRVSLDDWRTIREVAPAMHASRLFGVSSAEQAAAIMLKGYELGLGLAASFELIHVIQGKPTLSPRGALALIHRSGELAAMKVDEKPDGCTVHMKRRSGYEHTVTFTLEDAKRAGVVKADSAWAAYPANMLRWRAIGFCADVVFPDVLGGLKRADELGADVDETGNIIDGQILPAPDPRYMPPTLEHVPPTDLEGLLELFTPEQIMDANGGKIPGTLYEISQVCHKLLGQPVTA